jgi:glycosyltransferase involved in cell wall biosynthesis
MSVTIQGNIWWISLKNILRFHIDLMIQTNNIQQSKKVMKIKLLMLTTSFPRWALDSTPSFVYDFAEKFPAKEFEIIVLAPHSKGAKKFEVMDGMKVYRFPYFYPYNFQKVAYGGGIPYNIKNIFLAKLQLPLFLIFELIYAIKVIKIERIKAINSHWFMPQGFVGAICKRIFGISHISTIHSSEITLIKKIPFGSKISKFILDNSDFVFSVSKHRFDELISYISYNHPNFSFEKFDFVPMGVNSDRFNIASKEKLKIKYKLNSKFVILFVGILTEVKGCEYLIEAFRDVSNKISDIKLVIVGNGPLEESLKNKVNYLSLNQYIRFEGFVENSKISDYYSMADIVVVPSIIDSSGFEEGLPVVLLEALVGGKPIIATKIKGVMEAIEDNYNGILVDPKNSTQISDSILRLLDDTKLRNKLSRNAFESGKKYDWNTIVHTYVKVINEVCLND